MGGSGGEVWEGDSYGLSLPLQKPLLMKDTLKLRMPDGMCHGT